MLRLSKNKGQSALEYATLIAVVILALVVIEAYMQKGVQGRLKESTDNIGKQFNPGEVGKETYSYSWQLEGLGSGAKLDGSGKFSGANYNITQETRDPATGTVTNKIADDETVEKKEKEAWGTTPASHYIDDASSQF